MEVADRVKSTPCYNHYDHENLYYKSEDSGYTSFSTGAIECSNDCSSDSFSYVTNFRSNSKRRRITNVYTANFSRETPTSRRGVKRSFQEESPNYTPTREISCKIQRLKVNETNASTSTFLISSGQPECYATCYPSTPKKICSNECKISPYKKGKKLNFNIHSLKCENLPPKIIVTANSIPQRLFHLCHYEKLNIIKLLSKYNAIPPLKTIFNYLSNVDINNLGLAYPELLNEIYKLLPHIEKKQSACSESLVKVKENKCNTVEKYSLKHHNANRKSLKEINNIINENYPTYPEEKTVQPVIYEKVEASQENTKRQLCVQCWYPAIVVEESTGEKWVKCTKKSCFYQFCKICKCKRHPGEICSIQNDLEAPSPPKRKKVNTKDFVGTKKSKRILRRLQI